MFAKKYHKKDKRKIYVILQETIKCSMMHRNKMLSFQHLFCYYPKMRKAKHVFGELIKCLRSDNQICKNIPSKEAIKQQESGRIDINGNDIKNTTTKMNLLYIL